MPVDLKISAAGRKLIESFEGLRLHAYQDVRGIWTIGYGHTPAEDGQVWTQEEADGALEGDLAFFERYLQKYIHVDTSQHEFDAFASLIYNIGARGWLYSTALRKHNAGDKAGAADGFLLWDRPAVLRKRREIERAYYLMAD